MVVNVNTASGSGDARDPGTLREASLPHNTSGMEAEMNSTSLGTNSQLAGNSNYDYIGKPRKKAGVGKTMNY